MFKTLTFCKKNLIYMKLFFNVSNIFDLYNGDVIILIEGKKIFLELSRYSRLVDSAIVYVCGYIDKSWRAFESRAIPDGNGRTICAYKRIPGSTQRTRGKYSSEKLPHDDEWNKKMLEIKLNDSIKTIQCRTQMKKLNPPIQVPRCRTTPSFKLRYSHNHEYSE